MLNRIRDAIWMLFVGRPYSLGVLERTARELTREMANSLEMLNSWAARQAKRDKGQAQKMLDPPQLELSPSPRSKSRKEELRSRVAQARGLPNLPIGRRGGAVPEEIAEATPNEETGE